VTGSRERERERERRWWRLGDREERETTSGGWVVASVVLVEIRATFEEERGYGPADNSPPCHVLFLFSIFSLFNLLFLE
jgi:hypothetical protein